MNDVDAREYQLKSVAEKVQASKMPDSFKQQLSELRCMFEQLKSHGETVTQQLSLSLADRQALNDSLHAAKLWIDEKERELRAGKTLPLMSTDSKKKLEDSKVAFRIIYSVYNLQEQCYQLCRIFVTSCVKIFVGASYLTSAYADSHLLCVTMLLLVHHSLSI